MTDWDLLFTDIRIATMRPDEPGYGIVDNAALAVADGVIAWVGPMREQPEARIAETRSLHGRWLTPALIDCHTHLVFGADRAHEFEQRLLGISYEAIAAAGGGILSTVRATREASHEQLFDAAMPRVRKLMASGVATVEIKSGYGLDVETEIKMLEVARRIGEANDVSVRTTLLAAHTVPPEFADAADAYIDLVCNDLLPQVAEAQLADAVDAYCERIAFTVEQVERVFSAAKDLGLPVKLHADQLSDGGGAALAARFDALSADHLEYTSSKGIEALAESGSIAVLLPGAYLTLNETQAPPIADMRNRGLPVAIATDCNPGTSPLTSLREAMALGCRLFGLTPEECLAGTTRNAALALGLDDRGIIGVGRRADLAVWDIDHPRDLSYWLGTDALAALLIQGRDVSLS